MKKYSLQNTPDFPRDTQNNSWPWANLNNSSFNGVSNSHLPRISIITPSYNQGQFIEEAIRSVLLQGYPHLEYIIIDGGSTDNTLEIIKKYEPWLAYWVSEPDRGQSHAISKGIRESTGDWIAWMNADDIYLENAIEKVVATISRSVNDIAWVVGTTVFTDPELHEIGRFEPSLYTAAGRDKNYKRMGWIDFVCTKRSGIALPQPSSFWRRGAVLEAGGISETLNYAMDHELYGRLAYQGLRPVLLSEPLACFRKHSEQKTADFPIAFWKEELEIVFNWMDRVDSMEKQSLAIYAAWLNKKIKYYPYQNLLKILKSRFTKSLRYPFFS